MSDLVESMGTGARAPPSGREVGAMQVLLVEDDPADVRLLGAMLADAGLADHVELVHAGSLAAARECLEADDFAVALLDLGLPDASGLETFRTLTAWVPDLPVVVLSGHADRAVAVTAVREGAQDYLVKGRVTGEALERVLRYAVERGRLLAGERVQARRQQLLLEVGELALESHRLAPLLESAAEVVVEGLGVDRSHVLERHGDGLRLRAGVGWETDAVLEAVAGLGRASWEGYVASHAETVALEGLGEERAFDLGALLEEQPPACGLVVPIGAAGDVWGVLGAFCDERHVFTDDERAFVRQLTGLVATAVRRLEVEADRVERVKELTALRGVARAVQEDVSAGELAARVAEELQPSFQFPNLTVAVVELDGHRAVAPADGDGEVETSLSSEVVVDGARVGRVTVGYRQLRPFLDEEKQLLDAVAESLAVWVARHRAHARVADREQRLRALFDNALDAIITFDDDGVCLHANPAAAAMTGYDRETLVGMELGGFVPAEHAEDVTEAGRQLSAEGEFSGELVLQHADGDTFVADVRVVAEVRPGLHLGIMRDVTDRVRAEAELQANEERFRRLAESAQDVIYRVRFEPEVAVDYLNPATAAVTGFSLEDLRDNPSLFLERVRAEDVGKFDASRLTPGETRTVQVRFQRSGGTWIWIEDRRSPITEDGRVVGVQGILRDISARKKTEEALREALKVQQRATDRLQQVEEMKDGFLTGISHELRTPLSALYGVALTLKRHGRDLPEGQRLDMLDRLVGNAERLRGLMDDLLDVQRITDGGPLQDTSRLDLADVVARVAETIQMPDHDLDIDVEETRVVAVDSQVRRIVTNLLDNAVRHTPTGTTISVRTRATAEGALLTVADDGPGIPDDDKDRVFEPFWQGPRTRGDASPGTGIGLALVARLAELHGGRAWIDDRPDDGARFHVMFPTAGDPSA